MAIPKVYNGSSWVEGVLKSYNGASWDEVAKFYDGTSWVDLALRAELGTAFMLHTRSGFCWSGLRFRTAGDIHKYQANGVVSATGAATGWRVTGPATSFWIRCTVTLGTLTFGSDAAGVWHQLGVSDINFYINTSIDVLKSNNYTIDIATSSSGSNIIATQDYFLRARDTS